MNFDMKLKNTLLTILFVMVTMTSLAHAEIQISDLRVKAPIPGQMMTAGYFIINNTGAEVVSLVAVDSEQAADISMHTYQDHHGMSMMVEMETLELAAGEQIVFEEGGYHLMVSSPEVEALDAETFEVKFVLSNGDEISLPAKTEHFMPPSEVEKVEPDHSNHSDHSGHHHHHVNH